MKRRIFAFALVGFFVCAGFSSAAMTSTNFEIRWDTISTGGSDSSSSTSYLLRDTPESTVAGASSSSSYQLLQGYRSGIDDQILTFDVVAQNTSSSRSVTSLSGLTVTASTTGISINDLIAVVQDVGASQIAAIGRVSSLGTGTITVDAWKNSGTTPTVDGTNDVVYPLTSSSIAFGQMDTSSISTSIIAFETTAANDNGYVVQIIEDGDLRTSSADINDVSDGSVTAGSEEYGARSSDSSLSNSTFDTQDTALSSSFQEIASESVASFKSRNFLTLKAAISSDTQAGDYSHTITLIASGNF